MRTRAQFIYVPSGYTGSPLRDDYAELFYILASSLPRTSSYHFAFYDLHSRVRTRIYARAY